MESKDYTTIIYCRKSRGTQEELDNQINLCKIYCKDKKYDVKEIFSEIRSSNDFLGREQYSLLLDYVKTHGNIRVVCIETSRLNRNVVAEVEFNTLMKKHNSIVETVNNGIVRFDTPEQIMLNNIMASYNEYNYLNTKAKMYRGLLQKQKEGVRVGAKLYGYDIVDKRLQVNPEQADVVKLVFKLIAEDKPTKEVVKILKEKGAMTNTGRNFDTRAIRLLVQNSGYIGHKGNSIYPPIVSKELFLEANQKLKSFANQGYKRSYPLSSKIFCAKCGLNMILGYRKDRDAVVISKGMSKTCDCMGIKLDYVENIVLSDVTAYIEKKLDSLYQQLKSDNNVLDSHKQEIENLNESINMENKKLDKLKDLFLLDLITKEELSEKSQDIRESIELLEAKRERVSNYSLYEKVQKLQDIIVEYEEFLHCPSIEEGVKYIDKVLYWRCCQNIEINVIFKE